MCQRAGRLCRIIQIKILRIDAINKFQVFFG